MGKLLKYLDDLLVLIGCGMILYGTYRVWPEATWFMGGVMLIGLGVLVGIGRGRRHE